MKNIRFFLSENFHFLVVKNSVYLNRHVFVMNVLVLIWFPKDPLFVIFCIVMVILYSYSFVF